MGALSVSQIGIGLAPRGAGGPTPPFTQNPSITTDGTPQVGEIVAFDFGAAPVAFGNKRLYKDGADYADASSGSYTLVATGVYKLRVYITGNVTYAESAPITVTAAATDPRTQVPTFSLPAFQDDGVTAYDPTTNPPVVVVDTDASDPDHLIDKSNVKLIIDYDQSTSGAVSTANRVTIGDDVNGIMDEADAEGISLTGLFGGLTAGTFAISGHYHYIDTNTDGPTSAILRQTIGAATAPPATTKWGLVTNVDRSQYAHALETTTGNGDWRIAYSDGTGADECIRADSYRTDERFWALKFTVDATVTSGNVMRLGIIDKDDTCTAFTLPSSFVGLTIYNAGGGNFPVTGDEFTVYCKQATTGNTDGILKIWNEAGTLILNITHGIVAYRPAITSWEFHQRILLKTGQEAFAHAGYAPAVPQFG